MRKLLAIILAIVLVDAFKNCLHYIGLALFLLGFIFGFVVGKLF